MLRHPALLLLALAVLFVAGGASCPGMRNKMAGSQAPIIFTGPPTLENALAAVNASSANVRALQADNATLSTAGLPSLRANLVVERPRRKPHKPPNPPVLLWLTDELKAKAQQDLIAA